MDELQRVNVGNVMVPYKCGNIIAEVPAEWRKSGINIPKHFLLIYLHFYNRLFPHCCCLLRFNLILNLSK